MRRWLLAAPVLAVALSPSSIEAQTSPDRLKSAVFDTSCQAISESTHPAWINLKCPDAPTWLASKFPAAMQALATQCGAGVADSWMSLIACVLTPGSKIGDGVGFDGGGASGGWEITAPCSDFKFTLDLDNNLIVPVVELETGKPMVRKNPNQTETEVLYRAGCKINTGCPSGKEIDATTPKSAMMYNLHKMNDFTTEKRRWMGVYKAGPFSSSFQFKVGAPSYNDPYTGAKVNARFNDVVLLPVTGFYTTQWASFDCPPAGTTGGTFHYYIIASGAGTFDSCVQYATNFALSPNGYAVPVVAAIPVTEWKQWPKGYDAGTLRCPVSEAVIKALSKALLDKVATAEGKPALPVNTAKNDGTHPTLADVANTPDKTSQPTPSPSPSSSPTPTPTGSGSGSPSYDTTVSATDPTSPEIDWWPDLPTITLNLGSPECPVWTLDLTGFGGAAWIYTIDAHCPILADNAAAIGAIMILVFTASAVFIVLKA